MKKIYYSIITLVVCLFAASCTDLDEKAYDRVDKDAFYQNENSVKAAVASIYYQAANSFAESFFMLQELSGDQVAWRCWNGGLWGYDEGEKTVLSFQRWTSESKIIKSAWNSAWTTIGLSNLIIEDLQNMDPSQVGVTQDKLNQYVAEARMIRAWNYYNLFEIWGGSLPLNTSTSTEVPGSAGEDFDSGCQEIYDFIAKELDETLDALPVKGTDNTETVNRMNQGVNRILKARLLLNSELFTGTAHYTECEALCKDIMNGKYGQYSIASDYRDIYSLSNTSCDEVVFAFACEDGQGSTNALCNMRNMPYLPYNYTEYFDCPSYDGIGAWNCFCLTPSYDNSGNVLDTGGTDNPKCFLNGKGADNYGDKLGAVYERFDDKDIRKQNFTYNTSTGEYQGMFLKGVMKSDFGKGSVLAADADRDGLTLSYVDQVGTFLNNGRQLATVMNSRWGETNSGIRLVKYPMFPNTDNGGFKDIDEVEFRLAEVAYMIAECEMRAGNATEAKNWVNKVRQRYFSSSDWTTKQNEPGPGFDEFDMDWMLDQWGLEYLSEGRRRRTDLRRFDKFTQGQWWFFGRDSEDGVQLEAKRDRKYEWYPIPETALSVNPGLRQNPNY